MPIKPELSGGFRDYLPSDMIPRQKMFDAVRNVFERFGFVPLDTPGLEKEEILTGGDPNFRMHIFRARLKGGDEELALRFDLTVPLARVIAAYPNDIRKPFKRYQVGKVWRGEKQQAGRFREFVQFDVDTVGSASMMADAEIVAVMYETMTALGFREVLIRVNNRKILNGLAAYAGFAAEQSVEVLRAIDKLDKQGWESVRADLLATAEEGGIGLSGVQADAVKRFLDLRAGTQLETLAAVEKLMANSPMALEGIRELREIAGHVDALGVPADKWTIDLSVARGLGYYTGPVFETILTNLPSIGSVFSGGRYDDLVRRFSPNTVPATGTSLGVDRLFAAMEQLDLIKREKTVSRVMILNFDPSCATTCESLATELRRAAIPTEVYLGEETMLKGQLAYAVSQEYPIVIFIGPAEKERGVVQVRDMRARRQFETSLAEVLTKVKGIL